jgi:hypothetical protein
MERIEGRYLYSLATRTAPQAWLELTDDERLLSGFRELGVGDLDGRLESVLLRLNRLGIPNWA